MPPPSSHRKNVHDSKKNTDSTPAKKTPPVTPNTNPHDKDTINSLTARIDMLEKRLLELEGVLEVKGMLTASSSKKLTIFSNTNAVLALLSTALPQ